MQLFYHSSMITKVYAAFTVEVKNAERIPDLKNVINTIAMHRLENTKIGNGADETMTPATEVAATIVAAMASSNLRDSFESVQALPFNLDTLNNKDIENTYATMMQYGRYMPLMIPAKKSMISDKNQIMVAVLGIGEHPDTDFTIIVIDVQKMLRSLCLDQYADDQVLMSYPIVMDLNSFLSEKKFELYSNLDGVYYRVFIMNKEDAEIVKTLKSESKEESHADPTTDQ